VANKKVDKLSNSNYMIILLLLSLLAVGVAGISSKILISTISLDSKIVSAKDKANKQLDADLSAAPQLVSSYQTLSPGTATILNDALPGTADFPALISMLEAASVPAGITFTSISPANTATAATTVPSAVTSTVGTQTMAAVAQPYAVVGQITGSYPALIKLFANLEKSARPIRVTGVELTGSGTALTGTISLTTYYQDNATLPFSTRTVK
jgi:hypothetical protein